MGDHMSEPQPVIDAVEHYVARELEDAERYSNRSPFDSSGVWSLHQLARDIYALGVDDGARQEGDRQRRQHSRDRAAAKAAAAAAAVPNRDWTPDEETKARQACEWSDYRKDTVSPACTKEAHAAFLAGWAAAMGRTYEEGPLR